MVDRDWLDWHRAYDAPDSVLSRRLAVVSDRVRDALDALPPGPLRVVSLCAGQGRDLIGVLRTHPRRADVTARLVELDPRNAAAARALADAAGLDRVEVRVGDAALIDHYADLAPADLVLVCGVFGNISEADIERTIGHCAALTAAGGFLVWTRHREPPDLVPTVCGWFDRHGFALRWLSDPAEDFGVGLHRRTREPAPLTPGAHMFTFDRAYSG
ncbi:class I SAM-dependent methyltransferase [Solwaraspora sp. WMMD1047]|uniref:class I SAM-dependent methyltransferase n=1 Tax=Solwaraspora sp. WMMD1047 TaxID=3016102 RepID=UPI0024175F69|nr:class I SAM-dependent methyltransferase [Solwaraspora sp. WMMD1047]MDG4830979.1 class I SAM-dependent methyltransferase [Solwaraspora sp. WMMD1047]